MNKLKFMALGISSLVLVGCGAHPDQSLSRVETDQLVLETRDNALSGVQGLLVNTENPWLGARAHRRINGYPLPQRLRNKQISFQGYRSPTLSPVEIIRVITEDLGLEYEIDTSSFYLGEEQAGVASSLLADPGVFQGDTADVDLNVVAGAVDSSVSSSSDISDDFCAGEPLRFAARNEGVVAFARNRGTVAVSQLLQEGTTLSAGEVALNNILTGGLQRDLLLEGTPKQVFDKIVSEFDLGDWEYSPRDENRGKITFRYYVSQEFKVSLRPPAENVTGEASFPEILNVWSNLRKRLAKSIGADGEVSVYCDRSLVTVKTQPEEMRFIQDWVQNFSKQATQRVLVEVDVYEVTSSASDGFEIDLAAFSDTLDGDLPYLEFLSGGGRVPLDAGAAADGITGIPATLPSRGLSGLLVGKDASATIVADLIATSGNQSLHYSKATSMFSGSSKKLDFTRTDNITIGTDVNVSGDSANTTESDINEDLTTGIVMDIQSVILQDGQVLVAYNVEISSSTPGAAGSTVNFSSSVSRISDELVMRAGEQAVQTTSQISNRNRTREGIGDPGFAILGGQDTRSETLTTFVIVVRPSIIRPNF